jgi:hypothetical protein
MCEERKFETHLFVEFTLTDGNWNKLMFQVLLRWLYSFIKFSTEVIPFRDNWNFEAGKKSKTD